MHVPDEVAQGLALRHTPEYDPHLSVRPAASAISSRSWASPKAREVKHGHATLRRLSLAFHPAPQGVTER